MDDPYYVTNISTKVDLAPNQLNSKNIYHNIKTRTKQLYEKKCNSFGYVDTIYKIIDYKNGTIIGENFDGNVIFDITYTARICYPQINTSIQCNVTNINRTLISCVSGPITIIINSQNINKNNFKLNSNKDITIIGENIILKNNDHVLVKIIASDFHKSDDSIFVYGYLEKYIK